MTARENNRVVHTLSLSALLITSGTMEPKKYSVSLKKYLLPTRLFCGLMRNIGQLLSIVSHFNLSLGGRVGELIKKP
jgi:hypothetical protein